MAGCIVPPKFEGGSLGDITYWMKKMEIFFNTDWDTMMVVNEPFKVPKDKKGKKLRT